MYSTMQLTPAKATRRRPGGDDVTCMRNVCALHIGVTQAGLVAAT